ncbi:MAG: transposase [Leptospiraceae bacterium]|nr:MAG: transposase [Leptospiraceae bacterium]
MTIENQPHDWFFKMIFSLEKNIESFLKLFFPDIYKNIVLGSLKFYNTEKLSKKYKKFYLDIAFDCKFKTQKKDLEVQIYIVFEHKSYIDRHTPSQILYYKAVLAEEDEKNNRLYKPVIPIVFYHGGRKWQIPTDIPEIGEEDLESSLRKYMNTLSYILFDVSKIEDDYLLKNLYLNAYLMSSLYVMKNIFEDIKRLKPIFEKILLGEIEDYVYIILDYAVLVKKDIENIEQLIEEITGEEKMMTLTEKWKRRLERFQQGLEQGLQQGLEKGKLLDAQESIIEILEERFTIVPENIKERIKSIDKIEKLKELRRKSIKVDSLEEFIKLLG